MYSLQGASILLNTCWCTSVICTLPAVWLYPKERLLIFDLKFAWLPCLTFTDYDSSILHCLLLYPVIFFFFSLLQASLHAISSVPLYPYVTFMPVAFHQPCDAVGHYIFCVMSQDRRCRPEFSQPWKHWMCYESMVTSICALWTPFFALQSKRNFQ